MRENKFDRSLREELFEKHSENQQNEKQDDMMMQEKVTHLMTLLSRINPSTEEPSPLRARADRIIAENREIAENMRDYWAHLAAGSDR